MRIQSRKIGIFQLGNFPHESLSIFTREKWICVTPLNFISFGECFEVPKKWSGYEKYWKKFVFFRDTEKSFAQTKHVTPTRFIQFFHIVDGNVHICLDPWIQTSQEKQQRKIKVFQMISHEFYLVHHFFFASISFRPQHPQGEGAKHNSLTFSPILWKGKVSQSFHFPSTSSREQPQFNIPCVLFIAPNVFICSR